MFTKFKAVFLTGISVLFLGTLAFAGSADTEDERFNRDGAYETSVSTYVWRVSSGGHIVNHTGTGELGSPTAKWSKLYLKDSGIETSTGVTRHSEFWLDLPAADDDVILNEGNSVLTLSTLKTGGTTYIASDLTQPSVPRNVIIFASVTVGNVSVTTPTLTATCYIKGLDSLGRSTFTYQTVVTTASAAVGVGDIAWSYISSMTITATSTGTVSIIGNAVNIQVGTGDKIGLSNKINSTNDIYHVSEAGSAVLTYTANAGYNTIDFATDGNGARDYTVRYIQKYFTPLP